jgi:hypothetical protein
LRQEIQQIPAPNSPKKQPASVDSEKDLGNDSDIDLETAWNKFEANQALEDLKQKQK